MRFLAHCSFAYYALACFKIGMSARHPQGIDSPGTAQNPAVLLYAFLMRYVLGFDGGGTKTECVLMDETGAILAHSRSGASNVVNVGPEAAAAALAEGEKST